MIEEPGMLVDQPQKKTTELSVKNLIKNYGRAIVSFADSALSDPYLLDFSSKYVEEFRTFIRKKKFAIVGVENFKSLILPSKLDNSRVMNFKMLFKQLAIVFIKYFSVNWIYNSK